MNKHAHQQQHPRKSWGVRQLPQEHAGKKLLDKEKKSDLQPQQFRPATFASIIQPPEIQTEAGSLDFLLLCLQSPLQLT
eukprot:scaffold46999_cov17-Tisochrysis_lutea.AAC.1